jgi:hypothetical protein
MLERLEARLVKEGTPVLKSSASQELINIIPDKVASALGWQKSERVRDQWKNGDALGIVGPELQGMAYGGEHLEISALARLFHQPIHGGAKANFVSHQIIEAAPKDRADNEMPREYALNVYPRVLDTRNKVIAQPNGIMLFPGTCKLLRFRF